MTNSRITQVLHFLQHAGDVIFCIDCVVPDPEWDQATLHRRENPPESDYDEDYGPLRDLLYGTVQFRHGDKVLFEKPIGLTLTDLVCQLAAILGDGFEERAVQEYMRTNLRIPPMRRAQAQFFDLSPGLPENWLALIDAVSQPNSFTLPVVPRNTAAINSHINQVWRGEMGARTALTLIHQQVSALLRD